jgi:hypothetical protein
VLVRDGANPAQASERDQARRATGCLVSGQVIERDLLRLGHALALRERIEGGLHHPQSFVVLRRDELRPSGQTLGQVLLPQILGGQPLEKVVPQSHVWWA